MTTPPLFSTISAATEVVVSVAVFWFFWRGWRFADHPWKIITPAVVYETLFNITYMVMRAFTHEEGVTHHHAAWVTAFVAIHGALSLLMFLGLVAYVVWVRRAWKRGVTNPISTRPILASVFLVLWTISVLSGEAIYAFYWTGVIH